MSNITIDGKLPFLGHGAQISAGKPASGVDPGEF